MNFNTRHIIACVAIAGATGAIAKVNQETIANISTNNNGLATLQLTSAMPATGDQHQAADLNHARSTTLMAARRTHPITGSRR
jgi:hypothetical protein